MLHLSLNPCILKMPCFRLSSHLGNTIIFLTGICSNFQLANSCSSFVHPFLCCVFSDPQEPTSVPHRTLNTGHWHKIHHFVLLIGFLSGSAPGWTATWVRTQMMCLAHDSIRSIKHRAWHIGEVWYNSAEFMNERNGWKERGKKEERIGWCKDRKAEIEIRALYSWSRFSLKNHHSNGSRNKQEIKMIKLIQTAVWELMNVSTVFFNGKVAYQFQLTLVI